MENKLSNNEIIVLRMLYSGLIESHNIPKCYFDVKEKDNLCRLDLIELTSSQRYILTKKAINMLTTGGFVVKYPLSTDKGNVSNFKNTLQDMSPKASRALGLSIINSEFYKKWGKNTNYDLYNKIEESIEYYRKFDHPLTRLKSYLLDVEDKIDKYNQVLLEEFDKVINFDLVQPIQIYYNNRMYLLTRIQNGSKSLTIQYNNESINCKLEDLNLNTKVIHDIIGSYYIYKSKNHDNNKV